MEKDTPERSGARNRTNSDKTEMGSKTAGDSSLTSTPVSTTRQDLEQPTINEWFTGRISDTSADKDDAQSSRPQMLLYLFLLIYRGALNKCILSLTI